MDACGADSAAEVLWGEQDRVELVAEQVRRLALAVDASSRQALGVSSPTSEAA